MAFGPLKLLGQGWGRLRLGAALDVLQVREALRAGPEQRDVLNFSMYKTLLFYKIIRLKIEGGLIHRNQPRREPCVAAHNLSNRLLPITSLLVTDIN